MLGNVVAILVSVRIAIGWQLLFAPPW